MNMATLDQYFDDIAYLAKQVQEGEQFDIELRTFMRTARDLRDYLYGHTSDPLIHDHLDLLPDRLDMSPPDGPLIQYCLPRTARHMYGKYKQREKVREQVRRIAARYAVIRRLLR